MRIERYAVVCAALIAPLTVNAGLAGGEERRVAVVVGSNFGDVGDDPLLYAERDARRVYGLLLELGGVDKAQASMLAQPSADAVLTALRRARQRVKALRAAGHRVILIFYYSGHGDDTSLHLPNSRLPLRRLRQALADAPAELKISVLDACRTSRTVKGIKRGPSISLGVMSDTPRGIIELRASAEGEPAQESHELAGSVFTNYLVSGLRGAADVNRDGRVTLAETYSYVYGRTLARSMRGGALQHPSLAMRTQGRGELVMTHPAKASASLRLPAAAERYLIFHARSKAVVAEVSGRRALRLALPAKKFLVARREGTKISLAKVDLSWGGAKQLGVEDFRPISRQEFAVRGGGLEPAALSIMSQVGLELCVDCADDAALRLGAAFSYSKGSLLLSIDLGYVRGDLQTVAFDGAQNTLRAGAYVGWRLFFGRLRLALLAGAEFRYSFQHLERRDMERISLAGLKGVVDSSYPSLGPRAGIRLAVPTGYGLTASLALWGSAIFRAETDGNMGAWVARAIFSPIFGLGYAF